jgi:hypothetical protein
MTTYIIREGLKRGAGRYWGFNAAGDLGWRKHAKDAIEVCRAMAYGLVRDLEEEAMRGVCRPVKRVRRGKVSR